MSRLKVKRLNLKSKTTHYKAGTRRLFEQLTSPEFWMETDEQTQNLLIAKFHKWFDLYVVIQRKRAEQKHGTPTAPATPQEGK